MNKIFVKTKNVKNFIALTKRLKSKPENVPKMSLVFGEPGLGKSHTAIWWAVRNEAVYIRCSNNMSSRWLLDNLVENLGEVAHYSTSDLMKQAEHLLIETPTVLIIDEIDHILNSGKVIETVRDIYDKTNTPIILMGMNKADKKLKYYRHIYDRVSEIVKFEPFSFDEIKNIVDQLSEVQIEEDAINMIYQSSNRLRQVVSLISRAEELARANNIKSVNAELLKNGANKLIEDKQ